MVSAGKIYQQCLQTALASGGLSPIDPVPGFRLWTVPRPPGLYPQWKFLAPSI